MNDLIALATLCGISPIVYGPNRHGLEYHDHYWTYCAWLKFPTPYNKRRTEWRVEHYLLLCNWENEGCPLP